MINAQRVEEILRGRYPDLEGVSPGVFRGVDRFGSREYAIRYFDLNDQLATTAASLKRYQEEVLSPMYFSTQVATDLRWSHYLYFITSENEADQGEYTRFKAVIEGDREYARKQIVREEDVPDLLAKGNSAAPTGAMPVDLATTWSQTLEQHGLGFILDDDISVPDAVRRIVAGTKDKAARPVSPMALLPAETAAARHFLKRLTIKGFRPHPEQKDHPLGRVNLIVGSNGVGKTSLLEAIEFGYCGRNRRSSVLLDRTSVTLELAGTLEKLSSTTDSARLRARHSNWYAKTELKKVSIQDSFGKFNFLDTDAAVNLSVSASSDQIGADVARLVLGAAAENLADRLRRVVDRVRDELKGLHRDNATNKQLKLAAAGRMDVVKKAPKLSDSLFLELLTALKQLGWLQPPEEKAGIASLREILQEAATTIELLRHSSVDVLHSDPPSALQLLANLNEEAGKATALDERAKAAKTEQSKAQRATQASAGQIATGDALLPYARTDFARLSKQALERQDSFRARASRLALVGNKVNVNAVERLLDQRVEAAVFSVEARVNELQRQLTTSRASLQALEKTQSNLTVLTQRLRATAQDILQRVPNPDHCPVCHTEFESGQLFVRMMADVGTNTSEQAALLQNEIAATEDALTDVRLAQSALEPIRAFLGESAQSTTVREALAQIDEDRALLERDRTSLETVQSQVQQLQADGLSSEDLSDRLLAAGLAELPSLDELQVMQANHREALSNAQEASKNALQESSDVQRECEALAARLSINLPDSAEALAKVVQRQVSDIEAALGARQTLTSILAISSDKTADEITINLAAAQQLVARVATAVAQESANDTALDRETKAVADLTEKIEACDMTIGRLVDAERVLDTLTQQSSGGELTNKILAENAQEIARTFASIHMPNEFELKADRGTLAIVRRKTGGKVELDQMSTGQRAAFALSLFLAMNGRLRSGPPVLLFDDPVAHVDDINVLSFLDHLRHLAINGSRQIFFATADTKLAGLFRHKFRFLGDDFKELSLSRT
ncbi:AAA family ATPase [Orrella dioscoreae]|uniref:DNA double-strand break repair Rad50 ATPase n=1 Tax=Orrella dioscoreae TaxID=1851544 RepID=A0A1C3JZN3_9BURK|nr:AAA family ATPase [Orrella dioscoreae]SBT24706.1 DNA double-strand break repair Rad50 ATPase [Orrella dioscoreae]SOE50431.1 DNA double-strand break repair Rad50 ATPase [Orrella dioscoreae]